MLQVANALCVQLSSQEFWGEMEGTRMLEEKKEHSFFHRKK